MKTPLAALGTALALLVTTPACRAWNDFGHMVVAAVAYQDLKTTPALRARVDALVRLNPAYAGWVQGVPATQRGEVAFLMAARWPDAIKHDDTYHNDGADGGETPVEPMASQNIGYADHLRHKYWHYKDLPFSPDATPLRPAKAPNAQTTIERFRATLADKHAKPALKSYDLVWLLHLVGDVHQPLHATSRFTQQQPHGDEGGNKVALCAAPCRDELHGFWDGVLGDDRRPAAALGFAATLPPVAPAAAAVDDVGAWLEESFEAARADAYAAPVGPGAGPYALDEPYRARARVVATQRAALAGARLARLIRSALQ